MITVTITRRELEQRNACAEGLALHESISRLQGCRDGTIVQVVDWTPLHYVWLLRDGPAACEALGYQRTSVAPWLAAEGLIPRANLRGAYLSGAYRPHDPPAGWAHDCYGYLHRVTT